VDDAGQLVTVSVSTGQGFVPGPPQPLFELPFVLRNNGGVGVYDVSPDGQRILLSLPPGGLGNGAAANPLTVVTNWMQLIARK